jgi:hypothetical protein
MLLEMQIMLCLEYTFDILQSARAVVFLVLARGTTSIRGHHYVNLKRLKPKMASPCTVVSASLAKAQYSDT